jgi:hypothetical protein
MADTPSSQHAAQVVTAPPGAEAGPAELHEQVRRLRAEGGTYRSIAAAAGLAPATVHDLATGRRQPTPATTRALRNVSSATLRRARLDAGAPGCACGPCT